MRVFPKIMGMLVATLLLSIVMVGFLVYTDLTKREDDMVTFTRLAVKDAIVNIQTTEQYGYDYTSAMGIETASSSYEEYLNELLDQAATLDDSSILTLLQGFLSDNQQNTEGDALFRPIQFGMTFVDKEIFLDSLSHSLNSLVDANYSYENLEGNFVTSGDSALQLPDDIADYVTVEGPYLLVLDDTVADNIIYRQLYGIDTFESAINDSYSSLGISTQTMPNFIVYYDITIENLPWYSATTTQLLHESFLSRFNIDPSDGYTDAGYAKIPGKPINYTYRYVLLN